MSPSDLEGGSAWRYFIRLVTRVDYRHALPIVHITSGYLGRGSCTVPNVEPTVTAERPRLLSGVAGMACERYGTGASGR